MQAILSSLTRKSRCTARIDECPARVIRPGGYNQGLTEPGCLEPDVVEGIESGLNR
jgi:hypothetical protein